MKKGFTLIEVMISIVIFSLLITLMSNVVTSLNISIITLNKEYNKQLKNSYLIKTLYGDILNSSKIILENNNKNYSIIYIQTSNSLYNNPFSYVVWYVSKKQNSLMRLESENFMKLPVNMENKFELDKFKNNIKIFKIYKKNNKYFIFIKDKKNLFFEI